MSRITKEQVVAKVEELRKLRPQVSANYSVLAGGWRLQGANGFPVERVESRCFYQLLNVAIATQQGAYCA